MIRLFVTLLIPEIISLLNLSYLSSIIILYLMLCTRAGETRTVFSVDMENIYAAVHSMFTVRL